MSDIPKSIGAFTTDLFGEIENNRARKTKRELVLIDQGFELSASPPHGDIISFMHSIMCQVALPRSKVDGRIFKRRNGDAMLAIEAGTVWDGKDIVELPLPYGPIPRLVVAYISTYAIRNRTPEIPFGTSANDAMRLLGIEKSGLVYQRFRTQISAVAACSITVGFNAGGKAHTFYGKPVEEFEAWIHRADNRRSQWPAALVLGGRFYETLLEHAVPIDVRALAALKGSALAMDVYLYLVQRLHRIGAPVALTWWMLKEQFGQEYIGVDALRNFKQAFKKALAEACSLYPDAKVEIVWGGLKLSKSRPPVDFRRSLKAG